MGLILLFLALPAAGAEPPPPLPPPAERSLISGERPIGRERPLIAAERPLIAPSDRGGERPFTADELLRYLGFSPRQKQDILSGKIISSDFVETTDKELAITAAMLVRLPLEEVLARARAGLTLEADRDVVAFQDLGPEAPGEEDLKGFFFSAEEPEAVRELLDADPRGPLNLSRPEIEAFRALRRRFPARGAERDPACREAVERELRKMLLERLLAYRSGGLGAIAPYARGKEDEASAGAELRAAAESAKILARRVPSLHRAFLDYPRQPSSEVEHRFYWIKQTVEGRPALVLAHRLFHFRPEGGLILHRQFYVSRSYNCLEVIAACLPHQDGTLVFYTNRTSTDQAAGFPLSVRHSLGRKHMRDKVTAYFQELQKRARR